MIRIGIQRQYATYASQPSRGNGPFLRKLTVAVACTSVATAGLVYYTSGGPSISRGAKTSTALPLAVSHFTPTTVTSSKDAGGPTKLITLKLPPNLIPQPENTLGDPLAPVFSIYVKDSDIQVERPYTPLRGISEEGEMVFWVKRYDHGEVGRWLNRKEMNDVVEIRGPVQTFQWLDGKYDEVVLISGGTGITPFYQFLYSIFSANKIALGSTHITLMHASPSISTLPPPLILDDLRSFANLHPDNFSLQLFVDSDKSQTAKHGDLSVTRGRIDEEAIQNTRRERGLLLPNTWWGQFKGNEPKKNDKKNVLFVVCGPESMITSITGPRLGRPQNLQVAGGILGKLGYSSDAVKKL